jgi:bifunctional non-homologous end joining protein LigD
MSATIPTRRRAELASSPAWIKPQLAKLVDNAPDGPDWLHEIKFDGYRMHARLDRGRVQILTRRGNDWTDKYPAIAKAISGLPARIAYLDGELCGVLPDDRTAFNLTRTRPIPARDRWSSSSSTCCFWTGRICWLCRWWRGRPDWHHC